ncbi:hypothetical protein Q9L58_004742 [Maublancomyces gigas]|uniref:Uncharacterized protein n=1 Tax=Discina gigas TaxID=1032678 RepID=A0ABR3GK23_9PEZI
MKWPCQFNPVCDGTVPGQIKGLPEIAGKGVMYHEKKKTVAEYNILTVEQTVYVFIILFSLTLLLTIFIVAIDIIDFIRNGWTSFERDYLSNDNTTYIRKILEAVVEDLSKLQLVTGVSILIVGFFRVCHLTVYHWNLISYMAILAAVTQTATFVVLSAEWRKYSWVRFARYFATLVMFLMLSCFIVMKYWTKGWSFVNDGDARWPALCFFRPDQRGPVTKHSEKFVWTNLEVFMVPWMGFAFASIYQELYNKLKRRTVGNMILGTLNFALPVAISVLSAKELWYSRKRFSGRHFLSDSTEDMWSFGQIVPLVLVLSTLMSLLQSWNS